jgi:ACS family pantothenate transporter-like MFS transporter
VLRTSESIASADDLALLYVIWNNGIIQSPMSYWIKSFNAEPAPVPGVTYSVSEINQRKPMKTKVCMYADITVPLPGTAILIVSALIGAWISDGPLRGRRWPIIYFGAVVMLVSGIVLKVTPLYQSIKGHYAIYWLFNMGVSPFPSLSCDSGR